MGGVTEAERGLRGRGNGGGGAQRRGCGRGSSGGLSGRREAWEAELEERFLGPAASTKGKGKGLPKVTLSACKESAETTPSLVKILTVTGQLFEQKKETWSSAGIKMGLAQEAGASRWL